MAVGPFHVADTLTCSHAVAHAHTRSCTHACTHSLAHTRSLTHTHTRSHISSHTHARAHANTRSHTLAQTHTLTRSNTLAQTHTLTHAQTLCVAADSCTAELQHWQLLKPQKKYIKDNYFPTLARANVQNKYNIYIIFNNRLDIKDVFIKCYGLTNHF